jgi:hypothetical protein
MSSKLGRNDPCHCGSGRKYKRCCLDSDREQATERPRLIDSTSVRMLELYVQNKDDFDRRYTQPADELEAALVARIGEGLAGEEALAALREHMESVETRVATILEARSRLFWLHVSRRIPPKPLYGATAWTTALYRLVFVLALLKHGRPVVELQDIDITSGTLEPNALEHEDHVGIYQVEQLAIELNFAAAAYRRVAKGARLLSADHRGYVSDASDELEGLIASIDSRVSTWMEVLSPFGSTADASLAEPDDVSSSILAAQLNVAQIPLPESILNQFRITAKDDPLAGPQNFIFSWIDLGQLRPVMHSFDDSIHELTGLAADELLAFLWALGWRHFVAMRREPFAAFQFMQRGYWLTVEGDPFERTVEDTAVYVQHWWSRAVDEELADEAAIDIVRRAFEALAYTEEELSGIDLWSKAPRKPILHEGPYIIWDYSAFAHYFRSLFEAIGAQTGAVGNAKGDNFEDELHAAVSRESALEVWEFRKKLKAEDGSTREIDLGFVAGDTLYVAECKAVSAHPRLDRSEPDIVSRRWEKMVEYLGQADSLRQFLLDHSVGANYSVPTQITKIRACVCTPMPEYIPSRDSELWLTDEVPRVCVPGELISVALQSIGQSGQSQAVAPAS